MKFVILEEQLSLSDVQTVYDITLHNNTYFNLLLTEMVSQAAH